MSELDQQAFDSSLARRVAGMGNVVVRGNSWAFDDMLVKHNATMLADYISDYNRNYIPYAGQFGADGHLELFDKTIATIIEHAPSEALEIALKGELAYYSLLATTNLDVPPREYQLSMGDAASTIVNSFQYLGGDAQLEIRGNINRLGSGYALSEEFFSIPFADGEKGRRDEVFDYLEYRVANAVDPLYEIGAIQLEMLEAGIEPNAVRALASGVMAERFMSILTRAGQQDMNTHDVAIAALELAEVREYLNSKTNLMNGRNISQGEMEGLRAELNQAQAALSDLGDEIPPQVAAAAQEVIEKIDAIDRIHGATNADLDTIEQIRIASTNTVLVAER